MPKLYTNFQPDTLGDQVGNPADFFRRTPPRHVCLRHPIRRSVWWLESPVMSRQLGQQLSVPAVHKKGKETLLVYEEVV